MAAERQLRGHGADADRGPGSIFVTNGYRGVQPIFAIRPGGRGDISLEGDETVGAIAWSTKRGGPYMPTPVVYGDLLYVC